MSSTNSASRSPDAAHQTRSRKQPTQARSRETVRRLLAAANSEFGIEGYHTAQITRIAHEADLSVGALYRFFPDKAALAGALRDRYLAQAAEGYRDMLDSVERPDQVLSTFTGVLRFAADLQIEHTGYYRLSLDRLPDDQQSWGARVREQMVADFSAVIRSVGLDAEPSIEAVFGFVIEQVHAVLASLDITGDDRASKLAQLERMIGLYIADRFHLSLDGLDYQRGCGST